MFRALVAGVAGEHAASMVARSAWTISGRSRRHPRRPRRRHPTTCAFGDGDAAGLQQRTGRDPCRARCLRRWRWCGRSRRPDAAATGAKAGPGCRFRACGWGMSRSSTSASTMLAVGPSSAIGQIAQMFDIGGDIERRSHGRHDQSSRPASRQARVTSSCQARTTTFRRRGSRFRVPCRSPGHAGEVLQFERHVFEDVAGPVPSVETAQEAAAFAVAAAVLDQRRQKGLGRSTKPESCSTDSLQARRCRRWLRDRTVRPDVRSAQMADFEKLDVFRIRPWFHSGSGT